MECLPNKHCCGATEIADFQSFYLNPKKNPQDGETIRKWIKERQGKFWAGQAFTYAIINRIEKDYGIGEILEEFGFKEVANGFNNLGSTCYFYVCSYSRERNVKK
jgi:hypothetical protein